MTYKQEDIFEAFDRGDINIILHQCNCTEGMGAGFAKKVALKYPEVQKEDRIRRMFYEHMPDRLLGTVMSVKVGENKYICNLYSQFYISCPRTGYFDTFNQRIFWLTQAIDDIQYEDVIDMSKDYKIGIPLIASGLAADKSKKGSMTDLEYFRKYVEPIFLASGLSDIITVYYL